MNCGIKSTQIQSVIFKTNGSNKWNPQKANKWLKDNKFKPIKGVHKTINSLRYRLVDPKCFKAFSTKVTKDDISLVVGFSKKESSTHNSSHKPKKKVGGKIKFLSSQKNSTY